MINRRNLLAIAAVALALPLMAGAALAGSTPFTAQAFQAAQDEGRPVLVEVWASWCPTCRAQAPIVESLAKDPKFAAFRILRVDFDAQKDVVRELGARNQSTLIVFRGKEERSRAVGITDPAQIQALMEKAL